MPATAHGGAGWLLGARDGVASSSCCRPSSPMSVLSLFLLGPSAEPAHCRLMTSKTGLGLRTELWPNRLHITYWEAFNAFAFATFYKFNHEDKIFENCELKVLAFT